MKYLLLLLCVFSTFVVNGQYCTGWYGKKADMNFPNQYNGVTTGWQLYAPFSDEF